MSAGLIWVWWIDCLPRLRQRKPGTHTPYISGLTRNNATPTPPLKHKFRTFFFNESLEYFLHSHVEKGFFEFLKFDGTVAFMDVFF